MSLTLNQVIKRLTDIAAAHKMVRTAKHVKAEDFVVFDYKDVEYPAVWYTLNTSSVSGKEKTYRIVVTIADMHHVENMDELEMQSDCEQIGHDLLAQIGWDMQPWKMERSANFEYFRQGQEDILAGVTFEVSLKLPIIYDNCQVPTVYELPGGGGGQQEECDCNNLSNVYVTATGFYLSPLQIVSITLDLSSATSTGGDLYGLNFVIALKSNNILNTLEEKINFLNQYFSYLGSFSIDNINEIKLQLSSNLVNENEENSTNPVNWVLTINELPA